MHELAISSKWLRASDFEEPRTRCFDRFFERASTFGHARSRACTLRPRGVEELGTPWNSKSCEREWTRGSSISLEQVASSQCLRRASNRERTRGFSSSEAPSTQWTRRSLDSWRFEGERSRGFSRAGSSRKLRRPSGLAEASSFVESGRLES